MSLEGKVALITGAGAGLGRAVALRFAAEGARVTALSLLPHELEEVRDTAQRRGLRLHTVAVDVGDAAGVQNMAAEVLDREGHVDVLVNNAGIIIVKSIEETSPEEWDRVLATNLRGPFLSCRALIPSMKAYGGGLIINVSSQSGVMGFVGESAYCASKYGLEGLTATLALELEPHAIRVVSVHPGIPIRTPMSQTTYDIEARKEWRDPDDIAPGFVRLAASADASHSGGRFSAWELAQGHL